jgi:hypothetical protein
MNLTLKLSPDWLDIFRLINRILRKGRKEVFEMTDKTLLSTKTKKTAVAILVIVMLLALVSGQAAGIGHSFYLDEVREEIMVPGVEQEEHFRFLTEEPDRLVVEGEEPEVDPFAAGEINMWLLILALAVVVGIGYYLLTRKRTSSGSS